MSNAAVVGLLGAAFYNPIWSTSVKTIGDFVLVLFSALLLIVFRIPQLVVVIFTATGGIALAILARAAL